MIPNRIEVINNIYSIVRKARFIHQDEHGKIIKFSGEYKNLFIRVNEHSVVVKNSLSRYYFGNNTERLGYATFKRAISQLSDELNVDLSKSKITNLDLNIDLLLDKNCEAYYNRFIRHRDCGTYYRIENSLYSQKGKLSPKSIRAYDKGKNNDASDPVFINLNVLRVEFCLNKSIARTLKFGKTLRVKHLLDRDGYIKLIEFLEKEFNKIEICNPFNPRLANATGPKEFFNLALADWIDKMGGPFQVDKIVDNLLATRSFQNKNAYGRVRRKFRELNQLNNTPKSDLANEIITAFNNQIKFYS